MKDIREVVNDPQWQALRKSLVGTWKRDPAGNVAKLRSYLGGGDDPLRNRRILNYLTGSAFRIGIVSHPSISELLAWVRTLPRA